MRILAIETSCDDTAAALVEASGGLGKPSFKIIKSLVTSQNLIHQKFGGVVPNLAKREHLRNLPIVSRETIGRKKGIDAIAVTVGPGLDPALWTGIEFAKSLAKAMKLPVVGVNHLEGHIYSNLFGKKKITFPAVTLLISGGHTIIIGMKSLTNWTKLGETKDDAVGEAFDKVARMLGLSYPGGKEIESLAKRGASESIRFPRPLIKESGLNFSFSGLKTAVLYYIRDNPKAKKVDIAASFQAAIIDVLREKAKQAIRKTGAKTLMICGGVAQNRAIKEHLNKTAKEEGVDLIFPKSSLNTDNAAMIAGAAYINILSKKNLPIVSMPNLNL